MENKNCILVAIPIYVKIVISISLQKFETSNFCLDIVVPPKRYGVFECRNLDTDELVHCFNEPNDTTEEDILTFHEDDSGRMVYTSANSIKFFKFNGDKVEFETELNMAAGSPSQKICVHDKNGNWYRNLFGRKVSKAVNYNDTEVSSHFVWWLWKITKIFKFLNLLIFRKQFSLLILKTS